MRRYRAPLSGFAIAAMILLSWRSAGLADPHGAGRCLTFAVASLNHPNRTRAGRLLRLRRCHRNTRNHTPVCVGSPERGLAAAFGVNKVLILPLASRIAAKLIVKLSLVLFGLTACPRQ